MPLCVVLALVLTISVSLRHASAEPMDDMIGHVTMLEGTAKVMRNGTDLFLRLHDVLYAGDMIVTGLDGSVDIILRDSSRFFMGPKTRLRLVQLQTRPAKRHESRQADAEVEQGKVVIQTGGAKLVVTTPTSTIRASNTQFAVEVQ